MRVYHIETSFETGGCHISSVPRYIRCIEKIHSDAFQEGILGPTKMLRTRALERYGKYYDPLG